MNKAGSHDILFMVQKIEQISSQMLNVRYVLPTFGKFYGFRVGKYAIHSESGVENIFETSLQSVKKEILQPWNRSLKINGWNLKFTNT